MRTLPLVVLVACGGVPESIEVELAATEHPAHPQVPAILRDVALIDDDVQYTHPFVPGHRTTMDGRVAIRVQGGTEDIDRLSTNLSFFLFAPERIDEPILPGPAGAGILAETEPFDVVFPPALEPDVFRLGHHAICDPTTEFPEPGERPNPYACGPDTLDDCYDVVIVSSVSPGVGAQIWGTPVTVRVDEPKTASARIADVQMGEPVMGAFLAGSTEWTEPAVTLDGRLMTGRLGRFPRSWTNPETGETLVRNYDLAYSLLPDDAAPCDITAWTDFHPMSHAPYDPAMVGRYGLAAYPFRDTEGQLIPDGEDMGGTYPWVDREGANVFMTGMHGTIAEQSEARFPRRCVHEGCDQLDENVDFDRGYMVAGLWTHGKLVHLDGLINSIDWAVGITPAAHWWVDLYEDEAGAKVPVRLGSGRFINAFRNSGPYPPGYTHNANILDSLQNLPNFKPELKPVTPRDVVWIMSSGVATDEIAFDDLLDPNALIVANMQASVLQVYSEQGASLALPWPQNGEVRKLGGIPGVVSTFELEPDGLADIHLQNAATSLRWQVPAYGHIEAGEARIEPVALGGVEGRGLWLSGDAAVTWPLPRQGADAVPAYIGVFVDARAPAGEARELLRFPDGSGIVLEGRRVIYVRGSQQLHEVVLPDGEGWAHLGWRVDAGHRTVTLVHDGVALDRFASSAPIFSVDGGDLVVGRHSNPWTGYRGWLDNLVVLLHDVDVEIACNHAKGTLVDVGTSELAARAEAHPDWAHAEIAAAAGLAGGRFACFADHRDDYAAHLQNLPAGTTSVRAAIHFPEGPLRAGVPRPDSSENAFCLSCHTDEGKGGLSTAALTLDPTLPAEDDPRRQPTQPPRRVFGNIPAGWIPPGAGPGSPPEALQAPAEGVVVDHWVLPAG